jgi:hypothetical protein
MRRLLFFWIIVLILSGCVGEQYRSTHSIDKSLPPSQYTVIVISEEGPQLEPEYYEELGTVEAAVGDMTPYLARCIGAFYLLKSEARKHGADALIHAQCGAAIIGTARASGIAIIFKDREESLKRLKEIGAILK